MNLFNWIIVTLISTSSCVLASSPHGPDLDVYIRVYKIPSVQNWESKISRERGDITEVRVKGDLTATFPDGIVLIHTELAHVASDSAVNKVIRDSIYFGSQYFEAARISVLNLEKIHFRFDEAHSFEEVRFDREISSNSKENYRLSTGVKSVDEDDIILHIRFDSGSSSFGGGIGGGYIGTILNQTFAVSAHKILLIGFPSHDTALRGTVFWLAISVIKSAL
jgi:hypothetical protein